MHQPATCALHLGPSEFALPQCPTWPPSIQIYRIRPAKTPCNEGPLRSDVMCSETAPRKERKLKTKMIQGERLNQPGPQRHRHRAGWPCSAAAGNAGGSKHPSTRQAACFLTALGPWQVFLTEAYLRNVHIGPIGGTASHTHQD